MMRFRAAKGAITTAFDLTAPNAPDRFHLVTGTADRLSQTGDKGICLKQQLKDKPGEHKQDIGRYGEDLTQVRN